MDGVAGPVFIGANVEELEKLAGLMKRASELAESLGGSLTNMINELKFFGRFGEEFAALIASVTTPLIKRIVAALAKVGDDLRIAAQKQKQVSDGTGKPTPAGVDQGTRQQGTGQQGTGQQGTPAARTKQPAAPPPPTMGGRTPGVDKPPAYGRYVDYPDGARRDGGTRAWRNNNPGNIRWNDGDQFATDHGAIGRDYDDAKGKGHYMAVFPTPEAGIAAQEALLKEKYGSSTIHDMLYRYAPPDDNNDTPAYIAEVTKITGFPETTKIDSLTEDQVKALAAAMRKHEGQQAGVIIPPGGQK